MKYYKKTFEKNENGNDYVVGDLHGCLDHFHLLMEEINLNKDKDRVFLLGDLIDRGPNSIECMKLLDNLWCHSILGNHEHMMVSEILENDNYGWMYNYGDWAKPYLDSKEFFEILDIVKNLPSAIIIETDKCGKVGLAHAESPNTWEDGEYINIHKIIWERNKVRWADHMGKVPEGIDITIHGHTPVGDTPRYHKKMNAWWIDTGCFATGTLTALQIDGDGVEKGKPKVHSIWNPVVSEGWNF